ncbi:MAG TPA: TlpA disulfide reductase family protein [Gemmatimonadaceae bacterium]
MPSEESGGRQFFLARRRVGWRERLRSATLGLVAAAVFVVLGQLTVHSVGEAIRNAPKLLAPGTPAPPLSGAVLVPEDSGEAPVPVRRLADYRGEVVVLAFYSTGCEACGVALPELTALAREYRGRGLHVLAVNTDHSRNAVRARDYLAGMGVRLETIHADSGASRYNIYGVPAFYVIDRAGIVRAHSFGLSMADLHVEWVRPSGRVLLDSLLATPRGGGEAS